MRMFVAMPSATPARHNGPITLGYAVAWNRDPKTTWSHTPWSLREALRGHDGVQLEDIGLSMPSWLTLPLKVWHMTRYQGRWISGWGHSPKVYHHHHATLRRSAMRHRPDAILEIGDWGTASVPTFVYQDYSYLHLEEDTARNGYRTPQFDYHRERMLRARIDIQRRAIGGHAGIMSMSAWDADQLRRTGLVDPSRVHVVPPALNVSVTPKHRLVEADASREHRVLFVGRDHWRFMTSKAGDVIIDAVAKLQQGSRRVRLVIVGPSRLPHMATLPPWITLMPEAPFDVVQQELQQADVFCMPSRFEAYGIAFIEALAAGVPVIGRNAFAMPEFIRHGDNGYLLSANGTADELATLIDAALDNVEMRARVIRQAPDVAAYYAWPRVARDMVDIITSTIRS
ncbi:MAG: glycosyltransferase family 4 protein [Candidatus Kapabacteria bacterium]|nr:glycosyltransferase family 4 protein [Candidatus Kapabacteria bacterium]